MKLTKARVAALVGAVAGSLTIMMMSTWITGCSDSKAHPQDVKKWTQRPRVTGADAEPVAIIDGVVITVADFRDRLNKQSPYIRARYTSLERKKEFLDNLVRFEVLAKEAERRGLLEDTEVVRTMKEVMIQKLMQDEFVNRFKVVDITEKVMREYYKEQLRQAQKMETVGQLTGGIAHGFNNLLAIIMGNLELLADSEEKGSMPAALVERALRATRRGAELTRRLLAYLAPADASARTDRAQRAGDEPDRPPEPDPRREHPRRE